jgi:hypothetical protein
MKEVVIPDELAELLEKGCIILKPDDFLALRVGLKNGISDPQLKQDLLTLPVVHVSSRDSRTSDC